MLKKLIKYFATTFRRSLNVFAKSKMNKIVCEYKCKRIPRETQNNTSFLIKIIKENGVGLSMRRDAMIIFEFSVLD